MKNKGNLGVQIAPHSASFFLNFLQINTHLPYLLVVQKHFNFPSPYTYKFPDLKMFFS